ncbi:winged helix-turn-helix transcriptional regulator [Pseudonocardia sp. TRM90224]|uniref:winged helix-turn-helix transcriptional regulator n=1 Tax=Pseudonocardia sp. TRM90224 TaxID=2812678 RepID=UPI001E3E7297|nr:helix-turn-helix domain-containing protein [Pseudonocardia sp. TRM90224]
MNGFGQFCAVARALDVVGERWTLLIVRELLSGSDTFGEIRRGLPRIPPATLASRLRTLRGAGLVAVSGRRYQLTDSGVALAPIVRELARWTMTTDSAALTEDDLDTAALTWDMQRRVDLSALPERTVVLALDFTDRPPRDRHFWLHLSKTSVNLCRQDTGAPVDLWLAAATAEITRWWLGDLTWSQLQQHPGVTVHGDRALQRQVHRWFLRYAFTREALARTPQPGADCLSAGSTDLASR